MLVFIVLRHVRVTGAKPRAKISDGSSPQPSGEPQVSDIIEYRNCGAENAAPACPGFCPSYMCGLDPRISWHEEAKRIRGQARRSRRHAGTRARGLKPRDAAIRSGMEGAGRRRRHLGPIEERAPMKDLNGKTIAIIATDGFEKSELFEPRRQLRAACATVHVVSPGSGPIRSWEKDRSEEHTSELQSLMRISYAVFCLKQHN